MSLEVWVSIIGNVAIALSFVVAVVFGIAQTRAAARDRKERLTLETLRIFHTREFAELIDTLRVTDVPPTMEGFQGLPADLRVRLIQASQQMESIGMLVYERYIDLDLVDKTLGDFVSNSWKKFEGMFLDMRVKLPDPYLGEYFQWLAERVDERMNEGRQPYYLTKGMKS
jgi:hypothetical protein